VVLATGQWQNGLFALVLVANCAIGIVQELRAKRTLDRLAVLTAPHAVAVRAGADVEIDVAMVVLDDLLVLRGGDQVPADGVVADIDGLEIDESLLTGESQPVPKMPGDDVRSGSIVVAGRGRVVVTAVGADSCAARLAAEALVQELPAVEGLARVDVVCLDKTGTLTYGVPRGNGDRSLPATRARSVPPRHHPAASRHCRCHRRRWRIPRRDSPPIGVVVRSCTPRALSRRGRC